MIENKNLQLLTIGQVIDTIRQGQLAIAVVKNEFNNSGELLRKGCDGTLQISVSGRMNDFTEQFRLAPTGQKRWIITDEN